MGREYRLDISLRRVTAEEDEYRTILQKHDNSISSELIPDFLEAIQIRNTDYNLHEMKKKALDRFQSDLTNFQGKTWHDLIEQWDKNAPADEQWNLFKKSNVLPKIRPVFLWRREIKNSSVPTTQLP